MPVGVTLAGAVGRLAATGDAPTALARARKEIVRMLEVCMALVM